jgi:hypothetical protein
MAGQYGSSKFIPTRVMSEEDKMGWASDGSMPIKEGDTVITPDKAKEAIMEFLVNEIGSFIEAGFVQERIGINRKVEEAVQSLKKFVKDKIDQSVEDVVRDLKSSKIKEEITKGVEEKLKKLKESL